MPDPEENRAPLPSDLELRVFERDDAEAALHLALAMLDEADLAAAIAQEVQHVA